MVKFRPRCEMCALSFSAPSFLTSDRFSEIFRTVSSLYDHRHATCALKLEFPAKRSDAKFVGRSC